jgi:hypothetical protein
MISWSFVYGEIRLLKNSFWPTVLMHAVEDAFIGVMIAESYIRMRPGTDWLISPLEWSHYVLLLHHQLELG